jgi:hypothetical protein
LKSLCHEKDQIDAEGQKENNERYRKDELQGFEPLASIGIKPILKQNGKSRIIITHPCPKTISVIFAEARNG